MTQLVAKGAQSVSVFVFTAVDTLRRVRSLPDAFVNAIERFAIDKDA
jgi:hypothetical protein